MKKILWVTNLPLPEPSALIKQKITPYGGWLVNSSKLLSEVDSIKLTIAYANPKYKGHDVLLGSKISYFEFPIITNKGRNLNLCRDRIKYIISEVNPDIVHIFGTEYEHSLIALEESQERGIKCVVSIQGLVSIYSQHYMSNLPVEVQNGISMRDLLKRDTLRNQRDEFVTRGETEKKTIRLANHIIGRTTWDKACISQMNPHAQYYQCNEILRESFYTGQWDYENCEKYSIFTSQASYPIKGVHNVIEALSIIKKSYPETKLYVSGINILKSNKYFGKYSKTAYAEYIYRMIKDKKLDNDVIFTDVLNENQIRDRYLKSNCFVCPSSIENSPNALGEAMILGVPSISSYVGGVPDFINHGKNGFMYQSDASYMLAYFVCKIFSDDNLAKKISQDSMESAKETFDPDTNTCRLLDIYEQIVKS